MHKLIRNALGDAYRLELVVRNVAAQVKAPPMARQRRPDLSVEDARRLLRVIEGERLEALYVLALATGLRRGELLGLRWDDIDTPSRRMTSAAPSGGSRVSHVSWSPRRARRCG